MMSEGRSGDFGLASKIHRIFLKTLVGLPGFEPGTSCTPNRVGRKVQVVYLQLLTV
jgi:hypothetical protein